MRGGLKLEIDEIEFLFSTPGPASWGGGFIAYAHSAGPRFLENGLLACGLLVCGFVAVCVEGDEQQKKETESRKRESRTSGRSVEESIQNPSKIFKIREKSIQK